MGTPSCGRRELLADILDYGLGAGTPVTVFLPADERDDNAEASLKKNPHLDLRSWRLVPAETKRGVPAIDLGENPSTENEIAFLLDGTKNPVPQIEAFVNLTKRLDWHLSRSVAVVDCLFAKAVPASADFFKALVHFADVVLLTNRGDISQRWFEDFKKPYKDECFPCIFELVKKNRVANAAATLADSPRRMTFVFDELDPVDEMEFDEDNLPAEPFDIVAKPDPYFERNEQGEYLISVPSIETLRKNYG